MLIGHFSVEDGIFEGRLERPHFAAGCQTEELHDFFALDGRLEIADLVFFLDVYQLFPDQSVVCKETLLAAFVF